MVAVRIQAFDCGDWFGNVTYGRDARPNRVTADLHCAGTALGNSARHSRPVEVGQTGKRSD